MIQYNLRIDEKLKEKAQALAQKEGMSENLLYNKAITDYLHRKEHEEFVNSFLKRKVSAIRVKTLLGKIKKANQPSLYPED